MKARILGLAGAALAFGTCTQVSVEPVPVGEVVVSPPEATLRVSELAAFSVQVYGPLGEPLSGRDVAWASTDEGVATVAVDGAVTARGAGQALITATSEGAIGTALVSVENDPLESSTPKAPSGLHANERGSSGMDLRWEDNADNERWFEIQRRRRPEGSWGLIASPPPNTVAYEDRGLSAETEYEYRVRACNLRGCSKYSNRDKDKTDDD